MPQSLAVCSWSLRPDDEAELARSVVACGLHRVQLALEPLAQGGWSIDRLRAELDASGISICSGMMTTIGEDYSTLESIRRTGGLRPDEHWRANLARARTCAAVASELGLSRITLHAGFIPEGDPRRHEVMADRIAAVAELFAADGITLGLETGQETAETLLGLLSTISERSGVNVGVNFDPANMILYGMGDPARAIEELREHIIQVHMKDAIATDTPGAWGREVVAGDGEVDWGHFFEMVASLPRPVDVVIEREAGDSRVDDILTARKLAESFMQEGKA